MKNLGCICVIFFSLLSVYAQSGKGKGSYKQPEVCTKPPDRGPCRANVTYWFFQGKYGECKMFNYGGCLGNGNRFWTEKKCYKRCSRPHKMKLVCSVNPEPKPCNSTFRAWYFDHRDNACHLLPRLTCTDTVNRFMWCEKCMRRCSVENARQACKREYIRMQGDNNSLQQGQNPQSDVQRGGAMGTVPGLASPGAAQPAPMPPLEGTAQRQQQNSLGPVAQPPNIPVPPENGGVMSGPTAAAPGAGGPIAASPPTATLTSGEGVGFLGSSDGLSTTATRPGLLSETNNAEGGSSRPVIVVAVLSPPSTQHTTTGPEMIGQSGEATDVKAQIKGPPLPLHRLK